MNSDSVIGPVKNVPLYTADRTSDLKAPIMLLSGHQDNVTSCKFSPDGDYLASASADLSVRIWRVWDDCENVLSIPAHKSAVLQVEWISDQQLVSCSVDTTLGLWDLESGELSRRFRGHMKMVNCCASSTGPSRTPLIASGSDDGFMMIWDEREKNAISKWRTLAPVTAVCFAKDASHVYVGDVSGQIQILDFRSSQIVGRIDGHTNAVTSIRQSLDGSTLVTNASDSTMRIWNCAESPECRMSFAGISSPPGTDLVRGSLSPTSAYAATGAYDTNVYIWDCNTGELKYCLPGHFGCVNQVDFHPKQPIIASCSVDRQIYLGELALSGYT